MVEILTYPPKLIDFVIPDKSPSGFPVTRILLTVSRNGTNKNLTIQLLDMLFSELEKYEPIKFNNIEDFV